MSVFIQRLKYTGQRVIYYGIIQSKDVYAYHWHRHMVFSSQRLSVKKSTSGHFCSTVFAQRNCTCSASKSSAWIADFCCFVACASPDLAPLSLGWWRRCRRKKLWSCRCPTPVSTHVLGRGRCRRCQQPHCICPCSPLRRTQSFYDLKEKSSPWNVSACALLQQYVRI